MIIRLNGEHLFMGNEKRVHYVGGFDLIEKVAKERSFASKSEFAKYLYKKEPRCTQAGWRAKIYRYAKKNNITFDDIFKKEDYEGISFKNRLKTLYYDEHGDNYLSVAIDSKQLICISGDIHRQMKKAYSEDGGNSTVEQMSRKFQFPSSFISNYIKMCGWTHGMDIYTDEDIKDKSVEELVDETISAKRNRVMEKANKKYWASIEKDADNYKLLHETWAGEFKELIGQKAGKVKPYKISAAESPFSVVMSPTDLHYGKHGWKDEVGEEYSLEIARDRLLTATSNLISRFAGRPEKIIIATGSDWFHIDNEHSTTTRGTPQDTAGSPAQILMEGCKLAREHIDVLRSVSPVQVVFMRGNHDRHTALALMLYLEATYEDCEDVEVICDPKLRQYIKYGNNLLGFTHGDGVKGNDLPALMSNEERKSWGELEHHTWFHGHLHYMQTTEKNGALIMQLPSLAGHDRYHYSKGYTMNRAGMSAHIVDKEQGIIGYLFCPVVRHD
jgi:hypothetical protein